LLKNSHSATAWSIMEHNVRVRFSVRLDSIGRA
jgi:hypothetical protein